MKTIYFVRHGESEGNATKVSQDHTTPLTAAGHRQAERLAQRCSSLEITKIFTSDMVRAIDTGAYIAQALNLEPEQRSLFREWMTPRSVRGKSHDSLEYHSYFKAFNENYTDPEWRYEDAENFSDILKRGHESATFLESCPEDNILVVSHGKFMRFFFAFIIHQKELDAATHLRINKSVTESNTGITVFTINSEAQWKLITWNDHAHFAE